MPDKIAEISLARIEARKDVRDALAPFMSRAHLGEQRSVLVIGIEQGGDSSFSWAGDEADLDRIIGLLERVKVTLLSE